MNFLEQASRNRFPAPPKAEMDRVNYYAFFGNPTPENLAANHGGILAPQQKKAIEDLITNQKSTLVAFGGMAVFSVLFMGFLFWKIDASDGVISFPAQAINVAILILVFGVFLNFVVGDWFLFFPGDDFADGVVESAVGKVEWIGKRYQMRTDNRLLRSLRFRLPPPGEYRFYYLPYTGLVVMAEESRNARVEDSSSALFWALASANDFSAEDLSQNQKGLLSRHQENRLIRFIAFYGLVLLGGVALLLSLRFQILRALSTTTSILVLIVGVVLLVRFGWDMVKILTDLWNGRVSDVEGLVVRESHRSRYHTSYYYVVESFKFEVSEAAYNALIEGVQYRIWYAPHSKRLVSIETK